MTPTLDAVVDEAYRVFGDYAIGDALWCATATAA